MTFYQNLLSNSAFKIAPIRCIGVIALFMAFVAPGKTQHLEQEILVELRQNLSGAFQDESVANRLFEKVEKQKFTSPELMAYVGAVWIAQSKHVFLFDKMRHFNKGTEILDAAIRTKPHDVEMRFLRMTIQINAPGFLNYSDALEEDKTYVLQHYATAPHAMQQKILDFIGKSEAFSKTEKAMIGIAR